MAESIRRYEGNAVNWPGDGWVRGMVAQRSRTQGSRTWPGELTVTAGTVLAESVGAGRSDIPLAARCRLARAGRLLGPAVTVPDSALAAAGPEPLRRLRRDDSDH